MENHLHYDDGDESYVDGNTADESACEDENVSVSAQLPNSRNRSDPISQSTNLSASVKENKSGTGNILGRVEDEFKKVTGCSINILDDSPNLSQFPFAYWCLRMDPRSWCKVKSALYIRGFYAWLLLGPLALEIFGRTNSCNVKFNIKPDHDRIHEIHEIKSDDVVASHSEILSRIQVPSSKAVSPHEAMLYDMYKSLTDLASSFAKSSNVVVLSPRELEIAKMNRTLATKRNHLQALIAENVDNMLSEDIATLRAQVVSLLRTLKQYISQEDFSIEKKRVKFYKFFLVSKSFDTRKGLF